MPNVCPNGDPKHDPPIREVINLIYQNPTYQVERLKEAEEACGRRRIDFSNRFRMQLRQLAMQACESSQRKLPTAPERGGRLRRQ